MPINPGYVEPGRAPEVIPGSRQAQLSPLWGLAEGVLSGLVESQKFKAEQESKAKSAIWPSLINSGMFQATDDAKAPYEYGGVKFKPRDNSAMDSKALKEFFEAKIKEQEYKALMNPSAQMEEKLGAKANELMAQELQFATTPPDWNSSPAKRDAYRKALIASLWTGDGSLLQDTPQAPANNSWGPFNFIGDEFKRGILGQAYGVYKGVNDSRQKMDAYNQAKAGVKAKTDESLAAFFGGKKSSTTPDYVQEFFNTNKDKDMSVIR